MIKTLDREILEAALAGYEYHRKETELKIEQLRGHLDGHVTLAPATKTKRKRVMSAETRLKMAPAQQKRWAAKHRSENA